MCIRAILSLFSVPRFRKNKAYMRCFYLHVNVFAGFVVQTCLCFFDAGVVKKVSASTDHLFFSVHGVGLKMKEKRRMTVESKTKTQFTNGKISSSLTRPFPNVCFWTFCWNFKYDI